MPAAEGGQNPLSSLLGPGSDMYLNEVQYSWHSKVNASQCRQLVSGNYDPQDQGIERLERAARDSNM